jgi:aminoglycoside/choline kinase family phosphotransferase
MEDFGPTTIGSLLDQGQDRAPFDHEAAALLTCLHERFETDHLGNLDIPLYDAACFAEQAAFYVDHALPVQRGVAISANERAAFVSAWQAVLAPLDAMPRTLLLRDFMPDNLMALPAPVLGQRVGLIDYQDAGLGPAAYDLASWCEAVRRDGGLERLSFVIGAYGAKTDKADKEILYESARLLSAQRHMRILGRLVPLKRPHLAARVAGTLRTLCESPALAPLSPWLGEIKG